MKTAKGKGKDVPWTSTGSFIKKPTSGWLHNDRDLMNGSNITYSVRYLGSCGVLQSMRTLQYAARTAVTREAIIRMGEAAGKILPSKKRKVPRHLNKLLGTIDTRWGDDINLSISVESLHLMKRINDKEVVNHELSSISFAAGGEGITLDYIGYVAKDPIHDRACHVFDCPEVSHLVLSTIGQAFELRYKLYLNQPVPNPLATADDFDGDTWGSHPKPVQQQPPSVPERKTNPYSDDFGSYTLAKKDDSLFDDHTYDKVSGSRKKMDFSQDGVYNNPGDILGATGGSIYDNSKGARPKDNVVRQGRGPGADMIGVMGYSQDGVYDNPSQIGGGDTSVYDNRQGMGMRSSSVHQGSSRGANQIDITTREENIYSNNPGEERGGDPYDDPHAISRPRMGYSQDGVYDNPSKIGGATGSSVYDNRESLGLEHGKIRQTKGGGGDIGITLHEEHDYVEPPAEVPMGFSSDGCYDNPAQILGQDQQEVYDNKEGLGVKDYRHKVFQEGRGAVGEKIGILTRDESIYSNTKLESANQNPDLIFTQQGVYDNPSQLMGGQGQEGIYDNKAGVLPNKSSKSSSKSPSFDDPTYASISKNAPSIEQPAIDPTIPLKHQQWFHGGMSRIEAEALLEDDGEFLIRESRGKYVLTAKGQNKCHHLLLVDERGKVKARDKEFKDVPDLVHFFFSTKQPLVIVGVDVFLNHPVLTAFP